MINVYKDNPVYKSINGNLYSHDGRTLIQYSLGKKTTSFVIPDGVTSIGEYAFSGSESLEKVTIPYSVTQMGDSVFDGCENLLNIYCQIPKPRFGRPKGWDKDWRGYNNKCKAMVHWKN